MSVSSRGRLTEHPTASREPIDRDDRPRRYLSAFLEHEHAIGFMREATRDFQQRFGRVIGCRHVTGKNVS